MVRVKTVMDRLSPKQVVCATNEPLAFKELHSSAAFAFVAAFDVNIQRACVNLFRNMCFYASIRFPSDYDWVPFHVEEWMTWIDWSQAHS